LEVAVVPIKRKIASGVSPEEAAPIAPTISPVGLDDWEAEAELRRIERKLRVHKKIHRVSAAGKDGRQTRIDAAHRELGQNRHLRQARVASKNNKAVAPRSFHFLAFLTWTAITLGSVALLGGGISLGYSIVGKSPDFWNFGLAFIVGGQIALLVGLVMQLDRVRRDNRAAAFRLEEVDEKLHDLKTTAAMLGTSHSPTASSFYAHYAGGANAQLLLTDLKSQLDLLAIKIAENNE
jgi:hypothetical protein